MAKNDLAGVLDEIGSRMEILAIVAEGAIELDKARATHGKQHDLPLGVGPDTFPLERLGMFTSAEVDDCDAVELEVAAKLACQTESRRRVVTWADIFLEEAFEACAAEPDSVELEGELIQVIAMAASMIQLSRHNRDA